MQNMSVESLSCLFTGLAGLPDTHEMNKGSMSRTQEVEVAMVRKPAIIRRTFFDGVVTQRLL
jgi:hypothetical protein